MLIHPWDAALDETEWRDWLASTDRFGVLAVNNRDHDQAPLVVPTHFTIAGEEILIHLARSNPLWPHLHAAAEVRLAIVGDYAYIPTYWRDDADGPDENGVPTSYYSSVQFVCHPTVVDDPDLKAEILSAQLRDFQPEGRHAVVATGERPYGRMLSSLRAVRLRILGVEAKFKYDDAHPVERRQRVISHLQTRDRGLDAGAATQQQRRLAAIGDWHTHRTRP